MSPHITVRWLNNPELSRCWSFSFPYLFRVFFLFSFFCVLFQFSVEVTPDSEEVTTPLLDCNWEGVIICLVWAVILGKTLEHLLHPTFHSCPCNMNRVRHNKSQKAQVIWYFLGKKGSSDIELQGQTDFYGGQLYLI